VKGKKKESVKGRDVKRERERYGFCQSLVKHINIVV
jgi:hypothetical protein